VRRPRRPKTLLCFRRIVGEVIFYAVVSDQIEQVIEFFTTPAEAEAMLEEVLRDEPEWCDVLYIEPVELIIGGSN
jgi:hypothetical protein